ncbi:MAG: hypothetical protein WBR09_21055 [Serratia proteamaculans]
MMQQAAANQRAQRTTPADAAGWGIKLTAAFYAVMHVLLNHIKQHRVGHMPFQLIDHLLFTDVPVITANVRSVDKSVFSAGQRRPDFRYRNHATAMPAQVHATGRFWQQRFRQQRGPLQYQRILRTPLHPTATTPPQRLHRRQPVMPTLQLPIEPVALLRPVKAQMPNVRIGRCMATTLAQPAPGGLPCRRAVIHSPD